MEFLSDEFILYMKINSNHLLKNKSYILIGYYLIELEITTEEPLFLRKNPSIIFRQKKKV